MSFESFPQPDPYKELGELSLKQLEEKIDTLDPEQLSWLNSKLDLDLKAVEKDMADPAFNNMEMEGEPVPTLVNNKTANQLSLESAEISQKIKLVQEALKKEQNMEM